MLTQGKCLTKYKRDKNNIDIVEVSQEVNVMSAKQEMAPTAEASGSNLGCKEFYSNRGSWRYYGTLIYAAVN